MLMGERRTATYKIITDSGENRYTLLSRMRYGVSPRIAVLPELRKADIAKSGR